MNIKKFKNLSGINSQTSINFLALVLVNSFSFFATPVISKLVGTEGYGVCSIYVTYVNMFAIICALKVGASINTAKVKYADEFNEYCSNILLLGLTVSAAFAAIAILLRNYIGSLIEIEPVFIICLAVQGMASYVITFMTSVQINEKRAQRNLLLSFAVIFSTTILSIVLIKVMGGHYAGRIIGLVIPNVIIGIICAAIVFGRSKPVFNADHWKYALLFGIPVIFQDLSNIVLSQADKVMLQKSIGFSEAGIYSLGVTFTHVTSIIYQAINKSWVPFYYEDVSKANYERIKDRAKSSMFNMTCICMGFLLVSKEFFGWYAPKDYSPAMNVLPILVFGCYMQYLYFFPVNHELYHSNTIYVAVGTVSASIINIILNSMMIPKWGMVGASIATATSYLVLFLFHDFIARFKYADTYAISIRMNLQCLASVVAVYIYFYVFMNQWLIRWILAAFIGIVLLLRLKKKRGLF